MRTIVVKGIGNVTAKPDFIKLSLTVNAQEKEYETAMAKAAEMINELDRAVLAADFEKGSIKTISFDASAAYESSRDQNGNYRQEFVGYNCCYRLRLSFDLDNKRLSQVLTAISQTAAHPELSIAFTVKEPAKVCEELLIKAAANAKEKAEILCKASGVALGELQAINYNWDEINLVSPTSYNTQSRLMNKMTKSIEMEIEPEDINVHDTAGFTWEII